jgi:hypothetical protein
VTHPIEPTGTAIVVAVVAFVSTVLGATIGAVTNYVLAVRRERSERERDSQAHAVEVKRAARLIDLELLKAQSLAGVAMNKRYWIPEPDVVISSDAWQKYAVTIAAELTDEGWLIVARAFLAAEHINGSRTIYLKDTLHDRPISDNHVDSILKMQTDVILGREALKWLTM